MNIHIASGTVGAIGSYGSGSTTALVVVIIFALCAAHWRRVRRFNGGLEERKSYIVAEVAAYFIAWLIVTHASTLVVGALLGLVLGMTIGASIFSAVSNRVSGIFKSFFEWTTFNPLPSTIAAIVGFGVGFVIGSLGGAILLASALVGITTGEKARGATKRVRALREAIAGSLAAALGISIPALEDLSWYVMPDRTIVVERPAAALLNTSRLDERVATLLPHLEVAEASPSRIVLSPLSEDGADSRAHAQLSGGLVTGVTDASPTSTVTPKPSDAGVPEHVINLEDLQ